MARRPHDRSRSPDHARRGRSRPRWAGILATGVACLAGALGGCASRANSIEFGVQPDRYATAFDAARDVLIEARFEIDRVDAAAGVITTHPKPSVGLLAPWDDEQTTLVQEMGDATSTQRRRVRVTFEPAAVDRPREARGQAGFTPVAGAAPLDLRSSDVALTARVEVYVERVRRPGTRLETESIRQSSQTLDPSLRSRGMALEYTTTVDSDDAFAARLAERMRERLGQ
ncbi:MAG: hypothetical protein KDA05_09665 [Phycisphaerales bacterium]|nr:hypothetical protein [Phycisphaerales bacterium]